MVIDDQLNILPISSHIKNIKAIPQSSKVSLNLFTTFLRKLHFNRQKHFTDKFAILFIYCVTVSDIPIIIFEQ